MSSEMSARTSFETSASWTACVLVLGPDPNTSKTTTPRNFLKLAELYLESVSLLKGLG